MASQTEGKIQYCKECLRWCINGVWLTITQIAAKNLIVPEQVERVDVICDECERDRGSKGALAK